jgi:hypothetical protein
MEAFGQNTHLQGGTHGAEKCLADLSEADLADVEMLSARYRAFLDAGKTERECAAHMFREAEARGSGRLRKRSDTERRFAPVTK